jgi:hypothetical protein
MNLLFDTSRLDGLDTLARGKVVSALAQILLQAAGVRVRSLPITGTEPATAATPQRQTDDSGNFPGYIRGALGV